VSAHRVHLRFEETLAPLRQEVHAPRKGAGYWLLEERPKFLVPFFFPPGFGQQLVPEGLVLLLADRVPAGDLPMDPGLEYGRAVLTLLWFRIPCSHFFHFASVPFPGCAPVVLLGAGAEVPLLQVVRPVKRLPADVADVGTHNRVLPQGFSS